MNLVAWAGVDPVFFKNLVVRQIRQDYLENLTGFAWLILQPLMLLAVYAFVFTTIFDARIADDGGLGFVPFLAVAFWPWTAFSEAILKSSGAITAHSALVTKVAFANEQLPLAMVTATFLMHLAGFLAVLLVLQLSGTHIHWLYLLAALPVMLLLWLLACAISLVTSSSQVFVKDIAQILPPLMTFWFFTTPILYSTAILPESLARVFSFNPMTWFMEQFRQLLLFGQLQWGITALATAVVVPLIFWLALAWFRRFSGHFEDFL
jgi:ABC-type polysaccharide/polyol phosphate export permease